MSSAPGINHAWPAPVHGLHHPTGMVCTEGQKMLVLSGSGGEYLIRISWSQWDSGHLGKDVYKVDYVSFMQGNETHQTLAQWEQALTSPTVLWARLDCGSGTAIRSLEDEGFRYISGLETFLWKTEISELTDPDPRVRRAQDKDAEPVRGIGSEAFILDRLHEDPAIDECTASVMYGEWSANSIKELSDAAFVIEADRKTAGFVSLKSDPLFSSLGSGNCLRILLIAVASEFRGRGYGRILVNAAKRFCSENGFTGLLVGTSSSNTPAQNLYTGSGFRPYYGEVNLEKLIPRARGRFRTY